MTYNFHKTFEEDLHDRRQKDLKEHLVSHYRLLCDGIVISSIPKHLAKELISLLECFKNHLFNAITDPNFSFDKMSRSEYIKFHENNLGVKITTNLEIVPPGNWYPLAPGNVI